MKYDDMCQPIRKNENSHGKKVGKTEKVRASAPPQIIQVDDKELPPVQRRIIKKYAKKEKLVERVPPRPAPKMISLKCSCGNKTKRIDNGLYSSDDYEYVCKKCLRGGK